MKRIAFVICLAGMLLFNLPVADATTVLKVLGRSPFSSPPPASVQELKNMVETRQSDIHAGLTKAGQPELYEPFMTQFPTTQIDTITVKPGANIQWMMFKKGKDVRIIKDVVWSGKEPFEAFRFFIDNNGQRHEIIVAKACGNIALNSVSAIPNQSPVCRMQISPVRLFSGQQVNVDAGASNDPDGSVSAVRVSLIDAQGQTVEEKVVDQSPFVTQMTIPSSGTYRVSVVAIDNDGAEASSTECEQNVEALRRGAILVDAGSFWLADPAHFLVVRLGYEYRLDERFSLVGIAGIFAKVAGNDDGASGFTVDGLFNFRTQSGFFTGMGVGAWISDGDTDLESQDNDIDLVVNIGQRIFGDAEAFNTSVFAEARVAFDEIDDFVDYSRFGIGLRFQF